MFNWIGAIGSSWLWLYPLIGFIGGSIAYTFLDEDASAFGFTLFLWPFWTIILAGYSIYFLCSKWLSFLKWIKNNLDKKKVVTKKKRKAKTKKVITVSKTVKSKPIMPEGTDKASRLQALD